MTRELRLELDPWLEGVKALGPLIDPNLHSCGSVPQECRLGSISGPSALTPSSQGSSSSRSSRVMSRSGAGRCKR